MFRSVARSWEIAKESWGILMQDKELLLFPLISGATLLLVIASFGLPAIALGVFKGLQVGVLGYALGFIFYFISALIIIFFNSALVGAVNLRMQGHNPTLLDGLRCAWQQRLHILGYAGISATVGLLLRVLRRRGGLVARVAAFFGGLAWALATYVAIPVLVIEGIGPIDAIRKSAALIKKTWGHQVAGHVGFGLLQGIVTLATVIVGLPLVLLFLQAGWWPLAVALGAVGVVVQIISSLVFSTMATIYSTAVYRYASFGETSGFEAELLNA